MTELWTATKRGWGRLVAGRRASSVIGTRPIRDRARAFNLFALVLLAAILSIAFFDAPIAHFARTADPDLTALFRAFTDLAKADWMLVGSGVLGLALIPTVAVLKSRARAAAGAWVGVCAFAFAAIAGSGIAVNVLKVLFGRGRPRTFEMDGAFVLAPLTIDPIYASFPSGHATTAFAFAATIALFAPRYRVGLLALATMLAISRVVVGAHYLSDVLAGAMLGIAFTLVLAAVFHRRGLVFAVRRGQLTPKAPRALLWPLRRLFRP